jgi:hypothetical protein
MGNLKTHTGTDEGNVSISQRITNMACKPPEAGRNLKLIFL